MNASGVIMNMKQRDGGHVILNSSQAVPTFGQQPENGSLRHAGHTGSGADGAPRGQCRNHRTFLSMLNLFMLLLDGSAFV